MAVPGGELAYEQHTNATEPVLAVHGLSSNRRLWDWLRGAAPELSLIAPDLRGRGDSVGVSGPSTPQRHADDLALLLDHLGLDRVPVVGMSMGGFVALHLARRHPDRVSSIVLVDGGYPMAVPPGLTPDTVESAFADRIGRLERTWTSVEDYLDYFCSSTAPLLDRGDPLLRTYLEHDLRDGRVRLSGEALVGDARAVFFGDMPWRDVGVPVRFLHAQWGSGPDTAPAYPPAAVREYAGQATTVVGVDGVDHAGLIMTRKGAEATAELLERHCDDRDDTARDPARGARPRDPGRPAGHRPRRGRLAVPRRGRVGPGRCGRGGAAGAHRGRGRARRARLRRPRGARRAPRRRHRPVRRRQRRRRLRRARPVPDERGPRDRPRQPDRGRRAGHRQRRPQGGRRRARPLVPARPGQRALVDHRRQRRHQRRRPVLREVRRDPRLRARPAGGHGRAGGLRQRRAPGPAYGEGRGRLRPHRADGRLRGHPRRGHRGDAAPAPRALPERRARSSAPSRASSTPVVRWPRSPGAA